MTPTSELFWLTLTVILTGLMWVPYILNRCQVRGLSGAMSNPSRNDKPHADWANRLMFAHDNAVENLIDLRAAGPDPQRTSTIPPSGRSRPAPSISGRASHI